MQNKFFSQTGFTLIEFITVLVITSFIVIYTSQTTINSINAYATYSQRHLGLSDARHAINRMSFEILKIKTSDIISISDNRIDFIDDDGNPTNFRLNVNGNHLSLLRGNVVLLDDVRQFSFLYYDASNLELMPDAANINDIRRIGLSLKTEPVDGEGSITIATTLVPRSFVGYQKYTTK